MTAFASDAFTGVDLTALTSHAPDAGGTWTMHSSNPGIAGRLYQGKLVAASEPSWGLNYLDGTPASAEYDVQIDIYPVSGIQGEAPGVWGRLLTTEKTGYEARYYDANGTLAGGSWDLYEWVAGTPTRIAYQDSVTLTVGHFYTLKLEIRDATKKIFVSDNGGEFVQKGSTDTSNNITAAGKVGVITRMATTTTGIHIDNFSATLAGAGVTTVSYYPGSDVDNSGTWTRDDNSSSNLYQAISEEVASDAEYIQSPANPVSKSYTAGFASIATPAAGGASTDYHIQFRAWGDGTTKLTVALIAGDGGNTVIKTWAAIDPLPTSPTDYDYNDLSSGEIDAWEAAGFPGSKLKFTADPAT